MATADSDVDSESQDDEVVTSLDQAEVVRVLMNTRIH